MKEIKKKIHEDTGCSPDRIVLVPPGTVAKTSSGKIQRYLCRERYLAGGLEQGRGSWYWAWIRLYLKSFFRIGS
jgi:acyl-CoA synthetase (AMP-forming)/AMP-acid ligase II